MARVRNNKPKKPREVRAAGARPSGPMPSSRDHAGDSFAPTDPVVERMKALPVDGLLRVLRDIAEDLAEVDAERALLVRSRHTLVSIARSRGVPWTTLTSAAAVSRQALIAQPAPEASSRPRTAPRSTGRAAVR